MSEAEAEPACNPTREQAQALLRAGKSRQVPPDIYLCREGESLDRIFVLESGRVEIRKGIGGQSTCLCVASEKSVLGLMPVLDAMPCSISARTTEPSLVVEIGRETLLSVLANEHEGGVDIALALATQSIQALRRSTDELAMAIYRAMRPQASAPQEQAADMAKVQAGTHIWLAA